MVPLDHAAGKFYFSSQVVNSLLMQVSGDEENALSIRSKRIRSEATSAKRDRSCSSGGYEQSHPYVPLPSFKRFQPMSCPVRGGAMAHAIKPRDHAQALNRKVRALGMRIALSSKLSMGLLRVVVDLDEGKWKKTGDANWALTDGRVYRDDEGELHAVQRVPRAKWRASEEEDQAELVEDQAGMLEARVEVGESQAVAVEDQSEVVGAQAEVVGAQAEAVEAAEKGVDEETPPAPKPKTEWIARFGRSQQLSILFLHPPDKSPKLLWPFARVVRNIPGIEILSTDEVEVYHILKYKWLVLEGAAVDAITQQKGQAPVQEVELTSIKKGAVIPMNDQVKDDDGRKTRIPGQWYLRRWRHDTGEKSLRAVFGMKKATKMEQQAKRAKKVGHRLKEMKIA